MAHPKRKISRTRRDKRRTHYKATTPQIGTDPTTGESHLYHSPIAGLIDFVAISLTTGLIDYYRMSPY